MNANLNEKILAHPKYRQLVKTRMLDARRQTVFMLLAWFCYIALAMFSTSVGALFWAGAGVIVSAVLLTGAYARRAERKFDTLLGDIVKEIKRAAD